MKTNLFTLSLVLFIFVQFSKPAFASSLIPTGELFGYVKDSITGEPLPFAVVMLKSGETVINGAETDKNGTYKISGITPGTYTVEAHFTNYALTSVRGVLISAEKTSRLDFALAGNILGPITVIEQLIPLIDPQDVSISYTITEVDLGHLVSTDVKDIAPLVPGVFQLDAGHPVNIRGSREDATQYIVDGVKMFGEFNVPTGAMEQVSVFTGGIPAKYGDATGGFVVITTKSYFSHRND